MPWLDRSGRFSALKAAIFALLFLPGLFLTEEYARGQFGAQPITELIHGAGLWAIRLLLLSLAVTPARQILRAPHLILIRRMLGVATFAYAALHLAAYAADKMWDLAAVADEIVLRRYLAIGAGGLLLLLALAATSTDAMVRRLGGKRWQALQRLVYAIGLLALLHFFMQSKIDATEPTILAGFFLWLMAYRAVAWRSGTETATATPALLLTTAGAALATALGEALYFHLCTGVDTARLIAADFSLAAGVRPCWIVLGAGLGAVGATVLRDLAERRPIRPQHS